MNRYKPKKCKSPLKAIREKCVECMGGRESAGYVKRISECVSPDCPTYAFRFGKNPYHIQNLTAEQRKERGERLKSSVPRHKLSQKVTISLYSSNSILQAMATDKNVLKIDHRF